MTGAVQMWGMIRSDLVRESRPGSGELQAAGYKRGIIKAAILQHDRLCNPLRDDISSDKSLLQYMSETIIESTEVCLLRTRLL
jgi:hypothetical protein